MPKIGLAALKLKWRVAATFADLALRNYLL